VEVFPQDGYFKHESKYFSAVVFTWTTRISKYLHLGSQGPSTEGSGDACSYSVYSDRSCYNRGTIRIRITASHGRPCRPCYAAELILSPVYWCTTSLGECGLHQLVHTRQQPIRTHIYHLFATGCNRILRDIVSVFYQLVRLIDLHCRWS